MPCGKYQIWLRSEINTMVQQSHLTLELERKDGKPLVGFITAVLIPPKSGKNAYLPFFTINIGSKKAPLKVGVICGLCAKKRSTLPCNHNDLERKIIVTTMISSLNYA